MTAFLAVVCGLFGLAVGSFLNVVIYRVPRAESIVAPRSHCPSCDSTLAVRDNVPVVSWLALGRRCRSCHEAIPWRYPVVEATTAALFVAMAVRFGAAPEIAAYCVMSAGLVAIAAIDLEHMRVPRQIVYVTLALGLPLLAVASADGARWGGMGDALIGGAGALAAFFCVHLVSPKGLGFGDVRLAGLAGVFLGWLGLAQVLIGLFLGFLTGTIVGVALISIGAKTRKSRIPFAPFIAAGTVLGVLFGNQIRTLWLG